MIKKIKKEGNMAISILSSKISQLSRLVLNRGAGKPNYLLIVCERLG